MNTSGKEGAVFNPRELHRDRVFDGDPPNVMWCLHCERTYVRGEFRQVGDLQMCPYAACDGDAVIDAWDWNSIRDENPAYPENPEEGVVYPMYP